MKDDIRHVYPLLIIFFAVFLLHPGGLAQALPREGAAIALRLPPRAGPSEPAFGEP